jgi:hypothetical protein
MCCTAKKNDRINFVVVAPKGDQDAGADHFQNPVSLAWTQNYPVMFGGLSGSFSGC